MKGQSTIRYEINISILFLINFLNHSTSQDCQCLSIYKPQINR